MNASAFDVFKETQRFLTFSWIDYILFGAMFVISALIGIYFGCFGSKQATTKEYLLGGKTMSIFPIAMSLIASNLSGITLLAIPAEIYVYGTQYCMFIACTIAVVITMIFVFLPVFYKLQINSSYEYFNLRFDQSIRNMASAIFIVKTCLYIPIIIYIPAIAFNQVTGISVHYITPILCLICIFYTTLGGLKAVVWTDTLQFLITMGAMTTILFMGTKEAGGFKEIWNTADDSGRIEFFNFSVDPTERTTFWSIVIGMSVTWIAHAGIHQACIQRYLSLPSLPSAKRAVLIFGFGVILTKSIASFFGLIMYSKYKDCDPISSGQVQKQDQMLPFYVLDVASILPGLSGVFISGVFSTALSTMSTSLNTAAGTIYEDFLLPNQWFKASESNGSCIMKITVVLVGLTCVAMVFVIEKLGGILQIFMTFSGLTGGPLLGLFVLGMCFPSANTRGALYSSIIAFSFVTFMCVGQQYHIINGHMRNIKKPVSTQHCFDNDTIQNTSVLSSLVTETNPVLNLTNGAETSVSNELENLLNHFQGILHNMSSVDLITPNVPSLFNTTESAFAEALMDEENVSQPFYLFRISFYWYSLIGFFIVIVFGLVISHFTREKMYKHVHRDLLSPVIYRFLPEDYDRREYSPVKLKRGEPEL